jgi:phosphotransferase system  glucose/maltose/N-acetylglucosamine-specific IIC component
VQALAAFVFNASPLVQGSVNALAVALAAAITAALVRSDNLVPAITGAFQALIALLLAFGVGWSAEQQAAAMIAIGAVVAVVVRDRVTAPVVAEPAAG